MTRLGPYEVHPFADAFPLIEGAEFDELVMDIKRNGLREPITLNHDKTILIDGRNRYRACEEATQDLVFTPLPKRYTEMMILDLIVSKNVARRQLNAGQRAGVAGKYELFYAEAIKAEESARKAAIAGYDRTLPKDDAPMSTTKPDPAESQHGESQSPHPPKAQTAAAKAAKATGASATAVKQMKTLKRDAPDLYDAVMADRIALDAAYRQMQARKRDQPKPEPVAKPGPVMLTLRTNTGGEVSYPKPQAKATFNVTPGEGISWAQWSWNPVTGCLHGCEYCYARDIATSERFRGGYPVGFTPLFHHERLDAPANTSIPHAHRDDPAYRRVFVCSMADLYGRWVPDEWITQVHASMLASSQWEYLLLTKFPGRYVGLDLPPRAWVGTSVDEQSRVRLAEKAFRQIDGVAVKWLSLEPLREPLEFTDLSMFDWVVIGAQTETRQPDGVVPSFAPPFEWVARIALQAKEAGCKVHMKPNLFGKTDGKHPGMRGYNEYPDVTF